MAKIVSVMELAIHNPIVSVYKCEDDSRGDADDVHLHKNPDDEGANTIRHKHNDDDNGNFCDNDGNDDDKEEEEDDNDDNDNQNASKPM